VGRILSLVLSGFLWVLCIGSIPLIISSAVNLIKGSDDSEESNTIMSGGSLCGGILAGKLIGGFWFVILGIILGGIMGYVIGMVAYKIGTPKRVAIEVEKAKKKQKAEEEARNKEEQQKIDNHSSDKKTQISRRMMLKILRNGKK
jgi:hypothetical protein